MSQSEQQIWVNEGLLVWNGSVLELFRNDDREGSWRLHVKTVVRWAAEERRGDRVELKVWTSRFGYRSATLPAAQLPAVTVMMAAVDSAR